MYHRSINLEKISFFFFFENKHMIQRLWYFSLNPYHPERIARTRARRMRRLIQRINNWMNEIPSFAFEFWGKKHWPNHDPTSKSFNSQFEISEWAESRLDFALNGIELYFWGVLVFLAGNKIRSSKWIEKRKLNLNAKPNKTNKIDTERLLYTAATSHAGHEETIYNLRQK